MISSRRQFLAGLVAAPAVLRLGLWMPVKAQPLIVPAAKVIGLENGATLYVTGLHGTLHIGDLLNLGAGPNLKIVSIS